MKYQTTKMGLEMYFITRLHLYTESLKKLCALLMITSAIFFRVLQESYSLEIIKYYLQWKTVIACWDTGKDSFFYVHITNVRFLAIAMFGLICVSWPLVRSVFHGRDSGAYLGPGIWHMLRTEYNNNDNLNILT